MASVKYDPVPFATTATADSLQQHESIMSAFARHRDALRRRAADTLALGDAVLIVIDVFAIAYAPKHVSGSECALIGLLENILAPLWVSVWKSTSRGRVDGVGVDAAIQDELAENLISTQVGLRTLRRRALGVDRRRRRAPPRDTNRARSRREGAGAGEPAWSRRLSYSE